MRIYEIKDWNKGVKIRRDGMDEGNYVQFFDDHVTYNNEDYEYLECFNLLTLTTDDAWELYQEPEELIEKKLYKVFALLEGQLTFLCSTKEKGCIRGFKLRYNCLNDFYIVTNELAYTAYFKKDGEDLKVVRYVLASGEVIEV